MLFPSVRPGVIWGLPLESILDLHVGEKTQEHLAWMEGISPALLALALRMSRLRTQVLRSSEVPLCWGHGGLGAALV